MSLNATDRESSSPSHCSSSFLFIIVVVIPPPQSWSTRDIDPNRPGCCTADQFGIYSGQAS
jgi:hypothetical protein